MAFAEMGWEMIDEKENFSSESELATMVNSEVNFLLEGGGDYLGIDQTTTTRHNTRQKTTRTSKQRREHAKTKKQTRTQNSSIRTKQRRTNDCKHLRKNNKRSNTRMKLDTFRMKKARQDERA